MKNYKVTHYHAKNIGVTFDEITIPDNDPRYVTEYNIEAETPREAAILAHGLYNGYSIEQMQPDPASPSRTIYEQLADAVKAPQVGKNSEKRSVFKYDNFANHWIIVELGKFDQNKYIAAYNKENYARVELKIPKDKKAEWQAKAKAAGMSLTEWITSKVEKE